MTFMQFQGPGFTMEVPTDWFITSSTEYQAVFIAPPVEGGPGSNLSVQIRNVTEQVMIEDVARVAREIQEVNYPEYTVIQEGALESGGETGFYRWFTWRNPQGMEIVQRQAFFVEGGSTIFTVTGTRPVEPEGQDADALDAAFEHMLTTFTLKRSA